MFDRLVVLLQRLARIFIDRWAARLGCRVVPCQWQSAAELRFETGQILAGTFQHRVQAGPLKGFRISDVSIWGAGDIGARLLGTYEAEVQAELVGLAGRYSNLIDLGAADGFYCVGFVEMGYYDRSWAFEASDRQRDSLQRLIEERGLSQSVTVLGLADSRFTDVLERAGVNWAHSVLLCDIEGGEFAVLTEQSLQSLSRTPLIIELHPFAFADGNERVDRLRSLIERTHCVTTLTQRSRELIASEVVELLPDDARWLSLSEGRPRQMVWMVCLPKSDNLA